ncbi:hypothetical protein E4T52_00040 [Aureobasidium sp. EXF-3400]|nr:hypothetical protein E4T51_01910 [Aureobasidium sp. EXF-12344]KAI4785048.1 hypothetical protein E4T52_00040 [Aureobasidium sp. EXF-3400]
MPPRTYTKTFLPLESDPEIFTSLAHNLGLSTSHRFTEVYDLDEEPEEEVLAYVLAFPTSEDYDDEVENGKGSQGGERDATVKVESNNDKREVLWLRQTIHNACGLYALLHATCNGAARNHIKHGSILHALITTPPPQQSDFLSLSPELETLYTTAANAGNTVTPEEGVEVEWHYTCFVPDLSTQSLLELDGDRWGPLERGVLNNGKEFGVKAREVIKKEYLEDKGSKGGGKDGMFSVLVLMHEGETM